MHSSQQTLLRQANDLNAKLATSPLWKYICPDTGKTFYSPEKATVIRSPWTGKTFTTHPEKATLSDVGQELREGKPTHVVPK